MFLCQTFSAFKIFFWTTKTRDTLVQNNKKFFCLKVTMTCGVIPHLWHITAWPALTSIDVKRSVGINIFEKVNSMKKDKDDYWPWYLSWNRIQTIIDNVINIYVKILTMKCLTHMTNVHFMTPKIRRLNIHNFLQLVLGLSLSDA